MICIASGSLPPGTTSVFGRDMNEFMDHRQQVREVDPFRVREAEDQEALVRGRDVLGDERVRRVHRRHALEVDVRPRELRSDVVHVVGHAAQDRIDHGFGRIAAPAAVAVELLDPLEVDAGSDAYEQVHVLRDVVTPPTPVPAPRSRRPVRGGLRRVVGGVAAGQQRDGAADRERPAHPRLAGPGGRRPGRRVRVRRALPQPVRVPVDGRGQRLPRAAGTGKRQRTGTVRGAVRRSRRARLPTGGRLHRRTQPRQHRAAPGPRVRPRRHLPGRGLQGRGLAGPHLRRASDRTRR